MTRLRFRYHDVNRSGKTIARSLRDMERARVFFREVAFGYLECIVLLVLGVVACFAQHWSYGLCVAATSVTAFLFTIRVGARIARMDLEADDRYDHVTTVLQENVAGARVVRAFGREPDELVIAIDVPTAPRETAFLKLGRKASNTPAVVTVAIAAERRDGVVVNARVALGAVGPHPLRARAAEDALLGTRLTLADVDAAAAEAAAATEPVSDAIASTWYRRRMTSLVVARALTAIAASGGGA